ncbi:DUF1810 domain-containing protein [Tardiphaga alba]|uniref:DUF1810 domain-containing protein n=1 Tax=Tardiphaga alba TaxID=340268 RepID=A0ABX8A753_9BRAD|nr:DUF1810 domain-containing protein [Tardiphaga alba]QUS39462.1 DUF1810 domain-containing protein [Tardiphaga alba]
MDQQTTGRFDLQRYVIAQQPIYATALAELKDGAKRSHWMWFIFPQVEGLGHSAMAQHYAIRSMDEATAYLAHPLLGMRLLESTKAVLGIREKSARQIFGSPDDAKFRSSMTLFDRTDRGGPYREALDRYYNGEHDSASVRIIDGWQRS